MCRCRPRDEIDNTLWGGDGPAVLPNDSVSKQRRAPLEQRAFLLHGF
jgi:hypothetical protein